MNKNSPPRHRHDGTSPLPLGMDWSPPPKRWDGRNTLWPHDPHTGWSYCVTIPSWIIQTESGASDDGLLNPIVFYRVQIGIQSPEGISTCRVLLRRFSDFLKLFSALRRAFPKKNIPTAPPKHALLRINSSRLLLEERRYALEEWMGKLLSDIDMSRSVPVAAFLELEAAARSSFQDVNQDALETNLSGDGIGTTSSFPIRSSSGASVAGSSFVASKSQSIPSDYGSDNANETSDLGTPRQGKIHMYGSGTEDLKLVNDLSAPVGTLLQCGIPCHDNGLLVGETILDQPDEFLASKSHQTKENLVLGRETFHENSSKETFLSGNRMELMSEQDHNKLVNHARKFSAESVGSDISSIRGSELSNPGTSNSIVDVYVDLPGGSEHPNALDAFSSTDMQFVNDAQVVFPLDQRHKLNRVLVTMQRRLVTAKTDMEDLIARLNQEVAVKEYLTTKVKDLEVELESTKDKSKENLQQAILVERERVTQMQWDMDELRRKYLEMESKLKLEQSQKTRAESERVTASDEKELLLQELDIKEVHLETLQKRLEDLEMKSKADIKVLVKEVKFLRSSQAELKEVLNQSLKEKTELERVLHKEKQRWVHAKSARHKLLHECGILRNRIQDCSVNFLSEDEDRFTVNTSSLHDALDLLTTSDNRIGLLLAEAQLLARDDEQSVDDVDGENLVTINGDDPGITEEEVRKMLTDILIDNARLRKQVNSIIRCALKSVDKPEKEDGDEMPSRKTVLSKFLER